jgi:transcriptional regulator GlxA family with amidase domain
MGVSAHEYLLRRRLRHAQQLLTAVEENQSISAVAINSGFADQAHLTRHFRRVFGMNPGEYVRFQTVVQNKGKLAGLTSKPDKLTPSQ